MEDVLEVYHRPVDARRPLICWDETSKQLIGEGVQPLPAAPGQPQRVDYEYVRTGTANLFMLFAPLQGWRAVRVTARRTAQALLRSCAGWSKTSIPTLRRWCWWRIT